MEGEIDRSISSNRQRLSACFCSILPGNRKTSSFSHFFFFLRHCCSLVLVKSASTIWLVLSGRRLSAKTAMENWRLHPCITSDATWPELSGFQASLLCSLGFGSHLLRVVFRKWPPKQRRCHVCDSVGPRLYPTDRRPLSACLWSSPPPPLPLLLQSEGGTELGVTGWQATQLGQGVRQQALEGTPRPMHHLCLQQLEEPLFNSFFCFFPKNIDNIPYHPQLAGILFGDIFMILDYTYVYNNVKTAFVAICTSTLHSHSAALNSWG